jgi:hypothetical protein
VKTLLIPKLSRYNCSIQKLLGRGKMAYVEGIARNQIILFPEAIDDYIEADNLSSLSMPS